MVESEKTAIIASMAFGNGFVWIACGGMNQLGNKLPKMLFYSPTLIIKLYLCGVTKDVWRDGGNT